MMAKACWRTVCPLYPWVLHQWIQPTLDWKYSEKNIPESSKKQNLDLPHADNYSQSIYIVLDIICNLEMIWNVWDAV